MINMINVNRDKLIGTHYDALHAVMAQYDYGYDTPVSLTMVIDNDRVMGVCIYRIGMIYELLIRPAYRLKGAGRMLINSVVNKTKGKIKIAVREFNWTGANFLSHIGCSYSCVRFMHDSKYMMFEYDPNCKTKQSIETKVDQILSKFMDETPIFMTVGDKIL